MNLKIVKRDGHIVDYNPEKIKIAIQKANSDVKKDEKASNEQIEEIIQYIEELNKKRILVEDIQDIIEEKLMEFGKYSLAKKYITYRYTRELVRRANTTDQTIKELLEGGNEQWNNANINDNVTVITRQRDYLAGITSSDITKRFLLPEEIVKAHEDGIIHFHDTEYFAQNALHYCELINLEDMLQNGTVVNGIKIGKPKTFVEACLITTQILLEVTSSSYGSATFSLAHLATFVKESFNYYKLKYQDCGMKENCDKYVKIDMKKEISDGIRIINYGLNSMMNVYGKRPLSLINMYLGETDEFKNELSMIIEEFLNQRIHALKSENKEICVTPKIIYVLEDDNIKENGEYWYLTKLAAECTALGDHINYISEKEMKRKCGCEECYPCMAEELFLTIDRTSKVGNIAKAQNYVDKKEKYYGRFHQGMVTINLLDVAITSNKNLDDFWRIFDERIELCHKALQIRHKRLSNVKSDIAPILWQHGALARLERGVSIHELLHHGYSILSFGYAGLYECVKFMTDSSYLEDGEGKKLALKVLERFNKAIAKWKDEEDIDYTICCVETKAVTQKLAKCMLQRHGRIKGITDKNNITNTLQLSKNEDFKQQLKKEIEFQKQCRFSEKDYLKLNINWNDHNEVLEMLKDIYEELVCVEM